MRTNYEARFYVALRRITAYMTPEQLQRKAEKSYGLEYLEALEMAYENILEEAKSALKGYRPAKAKQPVGADAPPAPEAPKGTL